MDDFFASIEEHWPAGREDYHWLVLPGSELLRDRIAQPYQPLTELPGLAPVSPAFMHITIQHLAPVGDLTAREIERITGLVRERCADFAPFAVIAGRAEVWEHGIVCPVRPGYLLTSLWQIATRAGREITGDRFPVRPAILHPHLSLAYCTDSVPRAPFRAWMADSQAPEVAVPVTKLVLVAQQHDRCEITFRIVDEIFLGG